MTVEPPPPCADCGQVHNERSRCGSAIIGARASAKAVVGTKALSASVTIRSRVTATIRTIPRGPLPSSVIPADIDGLLDAQAQIAAIIAQHDPAARERAQARAAAQKTLSEAVDALVDTARRTGVLIEPKKLGESDLADVSGYGKRTVQTLKKQAGWDIHSLRSMYRLRLIEASLF